MIYRYPRYGELYDAWQAQQDSGCAQRCSAPQDFRDLQMLVAARLVRRRVSGARPGSSRAGSQRGRNFTLDDQALHGRKAARDRGAGDAGIPQAGRHRARSKSPPRRSIIPFCRWCAIPISPAMSHPDVPLPPRFRYPQDARAQLAHGARIHAADISASRRSGLWPSEGSVSDEVFQIAAEAGLRMGRHR